MRLTRTRRAVIGGSHTCMVEVEADDVRAFAEALDEPGPVPADGRRLAPVGYAVRVAAEAALACIDPLLRDPGLTSLLQVAHEQEIDRLLQVGDVVMTSVRLTDRWAVPGGTLATVSAVSATARGPVSRSVATLLLGGIESPPHRSGSPRPLGRRGFPRHPLTSCGTLRLTEGHARDYAVAARDPNPIHRDEAAARAAGHPSIIVPGMCLLWLATSRVVQQHADGDPRRVAGLRCRFAAPGLPGDEVDVLAGKVDDGTVAFRLEGPGRTILKSGAVVLRERGDQR